MNLDHWEQCPDCGHTAELPNLEGLVHCPLCNEVYISRHLVEPEFTRPRNQQKAPDRTKQKVFIDYCAFTYEPKGVYGEQKLKKAAMLLRNWLPEYEIEIRDKGFHGFTHSANIIVGGQQCGTIAAGGNHGRAYIELTGMACTWIDFGQFSNMLFDLKARLSRVDVAHDDFEGRYQPQDVRKAYLNGEFKTRGQMPSSEIRGPWDQKEHWGRGLTYYIGKRQNGKMLRSYHKGRQLGNPDSPWTRHEVEYRRTNKITLPLEILRDPERFLVGAWQWLEWVSEAIPAGIDRVKEATKITYESLVDYCRISYGKLVNVMLDIGKTPETICQLLRSDGVPKRLILHSASYS